MARDHFLKDEDDGQKIRARLFYIIGLYLFILFGLFGIALLTGCQTAPVSSPDYPYAPPPAWEEPEYVEDIEW